MGIYNNTYILLAKRYGASAQYPEEEAKEKDRNNQIKLFQEEQARNEKPIKKDTSIVTRTMKIISMISLIVISVLAIITMFWSPDMAS